MVNLPISYKIMTDFNQVPLKLQKKKFPRVSHKEKTCKTDNVLIKQPNSLIKN